MRPTSADHPTDPDCRKPTLIDAAIGAPIVIESEQTTTPLIEKLEQHPLADLFTRMAEADLAALALDIGKHGLREPITTYKGAILDGRHRYEACQTAKVEPTFTEFAGTEADALKFVISKNLHRRHLDESQRAMVAARLATLGHGQKKADASIEAPAISQPEAAKLLNVGRSTVQKARAVLESGDKDLVAKVQRGEVRLNKAYTETRATKPTVGKKRRAKKKDCPTPQALLADGADQALRDLELMISSAAKRWSLEQVKSLPGFTEALAAWSAAMEKAEAIARGATEKLKAFAATASTTPIPPKPEEMEQ